MAAYEAVHKDAPWHDGTFKSWAKERSAQYPFHFNHGVSISVADRDLTPWDEFTTKEDASPVPIEGDPGDDPDDDQDQPDPQPDPHVSL